MKTIRKTRLYKFIRVLYSTPLELKKKNWAGALCRTYVTAIISKVLLYTIQKFGGKSSVGIFGKIFSPNQASSSSAAPAHHHSSASPPCSQYLLHNPLLPAAARCVVAARHATALCCS